MLVTAHIVIQSLKTTRLLAANPLGLLWDVHSGADIQLTKADEWYETLVRFLSFALAVGVCALVGFATGYLLNEMGLNRYLSVAFGICVSWRLLGLISDPDSVNTSGGS